MLLSFAPPESRARGPQPFGDVSHEKSGPDSPFGATSQCNFCALAACVYLSGFCFSAVRRCHQSMHPDKPNAPVSHCTHHSMDRSRGGPRDGSIERPAPFLPCFAPHVSCVFVKHLKIFLRKNGSPIPAGSPITDQTNDPPLHGLRLCVISCAA